MTVRAAVFHHAVAAGEPWRTQCPHCDVALVRPGWRLAASALSPTGRCRSCAHRLGPPVAVVELLGAVTLAILAWRAGTHVATIGLVWAALIAVVLALVDISVHRLPDRLILTALAGTLVVFGISAVTTGDYRRLGVAALCGVGAGAAYFLIVFASPRGMGLGDAKLALLVGLTTGWFGVSTAVLALFAGLLLAGVTAIVLLVTRRVSRSDRLAHGPFMLLGALVAIILATL
jgi:leader peptidase (prepilin peptidase) / N-methyltransferase